MCKEEKQRGNTQRKTPQKFQSKKTSDGDARRTHVCDEFSRSTESDKLAGFPGSRHTHLPPAPPHTSPRLPLPLLVRRECAGSLSVRWSDAFESVTVTALSTHLAQV